MKIYNINKSSLDTKVRFAYLMAMDTNMFNYNLPIYLNLITGECTTSNFIPNDKKIPNQHQLPINICSWNMDEMGYGVNYSQEDLEYELKEKIELYSELILSYENPNFKYNLI